MGSSWAWAWHCQSSLRDFRLFSQRRKSPVVLMGSVVRDAAMAGAGNPMASEVTGAPETIPAAAGDLTASEVTGAPETIPVAAGDLTVSMDFAAQGTTRGAPVDQMDLGVCVVISRVELRDGAPLVRKREEDAPVSGRGSWDPKRSVADREVGTVRLPLKTSGTPVLACDAWWHLVPTWKPDQTPTPLRRWESAVPY
jgi:hypothetical protein